MKFGIRIPSLKKRFSARISLKRRIRSRLRMPRGAGFITNPKRALYNRVYNRTSISVDTLARKILKNSKPLTNGWSSSNFKSSQDLLKHAKIADLTSNGVFTCQDCGSDHWCLATARFLFLSADGVFCQECGWHLGKAWSEVEGTLKRTAQAS